MGWRAKFTNNNHFGLFCFFKNIKSNYFLQFYNPSSNFFFRGDWPSSFAIKYFYTK